MSDVLLYSTRDSPVWQLVSGPDSLQSASNIVISLKNGNQTQQATNFGLAKLELAHVEI